MSSIRRIQREIEESKQRMETMLKAWIPDVLSSRLVIRADETSYFDKVGVYSSTLWHRRFFENASEDILLKDYPGLTREDMKVCFMFETLRVHKIL